MPASNHEYGGTEELRILQLTAPARFGGLETVVSQLSAGLKQRGHAICVGCVLDESVDPDDHPVVRTLRARGVPVEIIQAPPRSYRKESAQLQALIRRFDADVVHTHGYHIDVIGGRAATRVGVPRVATVHGFTGGGWKNRAFEFLQRRSYRKAAAVIAVSRPLADELSVSRSIEPLVHVIRNAQARQVDRPTRDASRIELGIEGNGIVVGWLGRLSHEKGPDVVVRAMADPRAADLQLCMIGDGQLRAELEIASESGPGARISWVGTIPDAGRLLNAFDVVVLSSRTEGTPMVLLEAMDAGIPLVVTRVGGVPDVVGPEEALLVEPDDPEGLLTAVLDATSDRAAAQRRAEYATVRLETHFDPDAWIQAHEDLYRSVSPQLMRGER